MIETIHDTVEQVRAEFAPDPRTSIYEVEVVRDGKTFVLYGAVSVPEALETLRQRLAIFATDASLRDAIVRVPETGVADRPHAIVTAAVAPMLAGPLVSESHLSQVLLGHRVLVLREQGRWLQCRSADGYIGWIHRGYLRRMEENEARTWEIGSVAPIHISLGGEMIDDTGRGYLHLPWGARFGMRAERAILPDGREGRFHGDAVSLTDRPVRFPMTGEAIVASARLWEGAPYLWGGTTPAGVDCSGLSQAIFRTHGIELPRDSDQQALIGRPVELTSAGFHSGDLLFFAEQMDRVSHVAISTGGWGIIHSALSNGGVRENDLASSDGYERELRSLLVAARRATELES